MIGLKVSFSAGSIHVMIKDSNESMNKNEIINKKVKNKYYNLHSISSNITLYEFCVRYGNSLKGV